MPRRRVSEPAGQSCEARRRWAFFSSLLEIGEGEEVYYVIQGGKLLAIGLEDFVSDDARKIYDGNAKEKRCVTLSSRRGNAAAELETE